MRAPCAVMGSHSAESLGLLLDQAPFGVLVYRDNLPIYCNARFAILHSRTVDEVLACANLINFAPEIRAVGEGPVRLPLDQDLGLERWVEVTSAPIRWDGVEATACYVHRVMPETGPDSHLIAGLNGTTNAILISDPEERVVFTNRKFHELFESAPEQDRIKGCHISEIIRRELDIGHVSDPLAHQDPDAYLAQRMHERANLTGTSFLVHQLGGRWYEHIRERIPTGEIVGIYIDIHDRKLAEEGLARAKAEAEELSARLRAAVDAELLPVGFVMFNFDLEALIWNERYISLLSLDDLSAGGRFTAYDVVRAQARRGDFSGFVLDPSAIPPGAAAEIPCLATLLRCQATRMPNEAMSEVEVEAFVTWTMMMMGDVPRIDGRHWSKPVAYENKATGRMIEVRCDRVPNVGWVFIQSDVTEREEAERQLKKAKEAAEIALEDLKAAQDRLVHAEKLASLGQMAAGIAHEIKNPLNFVNNFAHMSDDLLAEMLDLIPSVENSRHSELQEIAQLLTSNLRKIGEHGARADGIVSAMLLHSRGGGQFQSVGLNYLVEEAGNLAYHGARVQNPTFKLDFLTTLDPMAGDMMAVPEDLTRVLVNLLSNAFYAALERAAQVGSGFVPVVSIATVNQGDLVEIVVRDNGVGMSEDIRAKLFTPFFTTKPPGQGTGLGLSLSYDIVVNQHGGTIDVASEPGHFTEFRIILPRISHAATAA